MYIYIIKQTQTNAGGHKRTTTMKKFQIRTNAKSFGENFGVYIFDKPVFSYDKDSNGNVIKTQTGTEAGFVKQSEYSHGTFAMDEKEAQLLTKQLSASARNCWVKMYEMIG